MSSKVFTLKEVCLGVLIFAHLIGAINFIFWIIVRFPANNIKNIFNLTLPPELLTWDKSVP